jgi:hypothetical protein
VEWIQSGENASAWTTCYLDRMNAIILTTPLSPTELRLLTTALGILNHVDLKLRTAAQQAVAAVKATDPESAGRPCPDPQLKQAHEFAQLAAARSSAATDAVNAVTTIQQLCTITPPELRNFT